MPFVLIFLGLLLTVAGIRNKQGDLYTLIGGDFTGTNNYAYWALSVVAVGSLGYIDQLKQFATALLGLLLVVLVLKKNTGFFSKFTSAINTTFSTAPAPHNLDPVKLPQLITPTQPLTSGVQAKSATGATYPGASNFNARDIYSTLMGTGE